MFLLLLAFATGLYVTESTLDVLDRLQDRPAWFLAAIAAIVLIISLGSIVFVFKLLFPRQKIKHRQAPISSEEELDTRIKQATESGLNVQHVKQEMAELAQRRTAGKIYIAVFGEVNMGKSSVINALLPDTQLSTSNIAGTTTKITHYKWQSTAGDELILADVPGTEQTDATQLSSIALAEALRAHIVIYVCDGDLSRTQYHELQLLYNLKKPTLLTLNKSDTYSHDERLAIENKLRSTLPNNSDSEIVTISCRKEKKLLRIDADGREEMITQTARVDVSQLRLAIQRIIDSHEETLDELRDAAVFSLASTYLDKAEMAQQAQQASDIVSQHTRRAVIGAMATVSPGTDIIVQAYLGTSMVKAICEVYKVPVRDFDIDTLLKLIQAQVGRNTPVILAIVGNGLKSFPGIGTLAGGLVHATAYGLIFDALGKTLVRTLASRGEFRPAMTARVFQETLNENMEKGTADFVKIVLAAKQKTASENP